MNIVKQIRPSENEWMRLECSNCGKPMGELLVKNWIYGQEMWYLCPDCQIRDKI